MSLRRQALRCRGGNGGSSRLGLKCPGRGRKRRKAAGEKPQRRPRLQGPHHRRRNLQRQTSIKRSLRSAREASGLLASGCGIEAARQAGPVCYWGSSRMVLIDSLVAGCRLKSSPSFQSGLEDLSVKRIQWSTARRILRKPGHCSSGAWSRHPRLEALPLKVASAADC